MYTLSTSYARGKCCRSAVHTNGRNILGLILASAMFKAPQRLQLRVGRRPCKGPRVDTEILKKIYTNLNCLITRQSRTGPKCTLILSQKMYFLKSDPCRSPKILGQPAGPKERSRRGAEKSLNTAQILAYTRKLVYGGPATVGVVGVRTSPQKSS